MADGPGRREKGWGGCLRNHTIQKVRRAEEEKEEGGRGRSLIGR